MAVSRARKTLRGLAVLAAAVALTVPAPGTATAWTNSLTCDSGGYNHAGGFQCWAYATGAFPLQSVNWMINDWYYPAFDGQLFPPLFTCAPGTAYFYIVIVDANGAVQVIDEPEICRTGEWN
ncbi:hypothetical protein JOD54_006494 [Actinokineospora baliensis]|uniref:hypothetical protein n=1 Tax=Actinokineospora baliensis TaxID=547056 RepID=UPI0019586E96|nr:hypothetical protein [Actinokineospora baliensis]MBM7776290.1 hypothetical protein [Actinokineospora baliensis]